MAERHQAQALLLSQHLQAMAYMDVKGTGLGFQVFHVMRDRQGKFDIKHDVCLEFLHPL